MKKLFALLIAMALCSTMVLSIAAEDFVPSISYKDHPDVVGDPEIITPTTPEKELDILITPVSDAINTDPADRNEAEEELVRVYEALLGGETLPQPEDGKDYVIRDMMDVSLIIKNDDPNAEPEVVDEDAQVTLTFDLGVKPDVEVLACVYTDDGWKIVPDVINNGDGTITVTLAELGVLALAVDADTLPPTFDKMNNEMTTWIVLMVVSSCAMVVMLVMRRKVCR